MAGQQLRAGVTCMYWQGLWLQRPWAGVLKAFTTPPQKEGRSAAWYRLVVLVSQDKQGVAVYGTPHERFCCVLKRACTLLSWPLLHDHACAVGCDAGTELCRVAAPVHVGPRHLIQHHPRHLLLHK